MGEIASRNGKLHRNSGVNWHLRGEPEIGTRAINTAACGVRPKPRREVGKKARHVTKQSELPGRLLEFAVPATCWPKSQRPDSEIRHSWAVLCTSRLASGDDRS